MKTKILTDFQMYISVPLKQKKKILQNPFYHHSTSLAICFFDKMLIQIRIKIIFGGIKNACHESLTNYFGNWDT